MAKFCEHCGAELDAGAKFCNSCGNAVEETISQNIAPVSAGNATTTIELFRKWRWVDFLFAANVFVDGIQVGKLSNGQTKIFEVTPGVHKLQLKMNWSFMSGFLRSDATDFRINAGDALKFNCNFKFGAFATVTGLWMPISLFSGFKVIKIEQVAA